MQGKFLKSLRISNKLTQKDLAELLGISARHVAFLESDGRKISDELRLKYSDIFCINVCEIFINTLMNKTAKCNAPNCSNNYKKKIS